MSGKAKISAKQFPGQHEGEVVQMLFRQHPLVMRKALIIGLLLILAAVLPLAFPAVYASDKLISWFTKAALGVTGVVFLAWFYRWIGWYYTVYLVTDRRIIAIKQRGLFDRQVEEWQLDNITNLNYRIGGFQAVLFGFGDLTAKTYIGDLEMKTIHQPAEIHDELLSIIRKAGGGSGGGSTPAPN